MFAATRALTWELLARQRWLLLGLAVYLLAGAVFVQLAPGLAQTPFIVQTLVLPLLVPLPFLLTALMHDGRAPLDRPTSGFPARLFTLPVPSAVLALPPLVLGTVLLPLLYLFVAVALLRPSGVGAPLAAPALLVAVAIAWVPALTWLPFPLPWLRPAPFVVMLPGVVSLAIVLGNVEVPQPPVVLGLGAALGAGYGVGVAGVARARHAGTGETTGS